MFFNEAFMAYQMANFGLNMPPDFEIYPLNV